MSSRIGFPTLFGVLVSIAAAILGTGCSSSGKPAVHFEVRSTNAITSITNLVSAGGTNSIPPQWLIPSTNAYTLGPGDQIDIELIGEGEGPESVFVGPDGRIYFNLLPGLQVWGFTLEQTRKKLADSLKTLVRDPQIAITLREVNSQRVWVMGRINTPGIYPLDTPMTVRAQTQHSVAEYSPWEGTELPCSVVHYLRGTTVSGVTHRPLNVWRRPSVDSTARC